MKKLKDGAAWNLSGAIASRLMYAVAFILTARVLGIEGFGVLGMLQSTVFVLEVIAGAGFGVTATRYIAQFKCQDPARASRVITMVEAGVGLLAATIAACILAFSEPISIFLFQNSDQAAAIRVTAFVVFLGSMSTLQTGILSGFEAFRRNAQINILSGVAVLMFMVVGALVAGPTGAIGGLGLARGLTYYLSRGAVREEQQRFGIARALTIRDALPELDLVTHYSVPSLLTNGLAAATLWTSNALVIKQPNGLVEMAVTNIGNQWRNIFVFLPSIISQVAAPLFAQLSSENAQDREHFRQLYRKIWQINFAVLVPCALACIIGSPMILKLYNKDLHQFAFTFDLFIIAVAIQVLQTPGVTVLQSRGYTWSNFWMNVVWSSVLLISAVFLIRYGAMGIAVANIFAFIVFGLLLRRKMQSVA